MPVTLQVGPENRCRAETWGQNMPPCPRKLPNLTNPSRFISFLPVISIIYGFYILHFPHTLYCI